jgi:hypothetical protein
LIICFETGIIQITHDKKKKLTRRAAVFFPDMNYSFYVTEKVFQYSFNKYYHSINDPLKNSGKIQQMNLC